MDTNDQDPKAFLDEMQILLKSHWDKLKEKCKTLEESLEKMNAERDELKMELTLSREQAIRSEKEKDELVSTMVDLLEEFQKNPILGMNFKVKETSSFLKDIKNLAQPLLHTSNDCVPAINTISTSHVEERNTNRPVLPKETDNDVYFNSTSKSQSKQSDRKSKEDNSSKSLDQVQTAEDESVEKSIPIPNSSDSEPFNFDSEIPSISSLEEDDSDIELCLSGDENVNSDFNESPEPPVPASKMELIVYLPRITFRDKSLENRMISAPRSEVHHLEKSSKSLKDPVVSTSQSEVHDRLENDCEKKYKSPKDPVISSPKIEVHHLENDCEKKGVVKSDGDELFYQSKIVTKGINKDVVKSHGDEPFYESKIVIKGINTSSTSNIPYSSSTLGLQSTPKKGHRECTICRIENTQSNYEFDSHHALDKHLFENHPDCGPHYFRCDFGDNYCIKHFTRKTSLLRHKLQYHKDNNINVPKKEPARRPNRYMERECLICRYENGLSDYVYKTYKDLNKHLNEDHSDCSKYYFRCEFGNGSCGNYYSSKKNLGKHHIKVHKKLQGGKNAVKKGPGRGRGRRPKQMKCAVCEEEFLFLDDLQKHMKEYHDICEKVEENEEYSSQDSDTPKACILCDEIFLSQRELNKHLKKVHPREFREVRKLDVDFREKPKLLPRLRRKIDSEHDTSMELSSAKRKNSEEKETDDAKKRKESYDFYELVYGSPEELEQYFAPADTKTDPRSH